MLVSFDNEALISYFVLLSFFIWCIHSFVLNIFLKPLFIVFYKLQTNDNDKQIIVILNYNEREREDKRERGNIALVFF